MSEWQPIETAPLEQFDNDKWFKMHSPNLLLWIGRITIVYYSFTEKGKGRWKENGYNCNPTHWMPLPQPPK